MVECLSSSRGKLIVPCVVLAEVGYFIERDLGQTVLSAFAEDLVDGRYLVDCGGRDFARVGELLSRYSDLPLGLTDSAVIGCAERNGGRVATLDHRHFGVVAREGTIQIVP